MDINFSNEKDEDKKNSLERALNYMGLKPNTNVKDIKIEGLEKISEGALLNYLPVNIGDSLDESRIQESIRSVYSSGFFKNIEFRKDDSGVLIISVLERPSIASINFEGNKDIKTEDLEDSLNNIGFKIGRNYDPSILDEIERSLIQSSRFILVLVNTMPE